MPSSLAVAHSWLGLGVGVGVRLRLRVGVGVRVRVRVRGSVRLTWSIRSASVYGLSPNMQPPYLVGVRVRVRVRVGVKVRVRVGVRVGASNGRVLLDHG